jgi:hypothetical protein
LGEIKVVGTKKEEENGVCEERGKKLFFYIKE